MKKFLFFFILAATNSAFAQLRCIDKLLPIPRPSAAHQVTAAEWRAGQEDVMGPDEAKRAVSTLVFSKLLCRSNEIDFPAAPTCGPVDVTIPGSNTCYYYSTLGYFIITQDSEKNANIIFNKTKRVF
ncbi:MAG: hypothetical protein K2P81_07460 [Bacteriovoracaceae bacterium]|nr:hypothetical protein [Bacteriovoracaceae bacterium]